MEISNLADDQLLQLSTKLHTDRAINHKALVEPHTEHSHTFEEMCLEHLCSTVEHQLCVNAGAVSQLISDHKGSVSQFPPQGPPQPTMLSDDEKSLDVIINVGAKTFHAHRRSLMSCSRMFFYMFSDNYKESIEGVVNIRDMKEDVFEEMLRYINNGCPPRIPNFEFAMDLLNASHLYGIDHLFYLSQKAASKYISPENLVSLYHFHERYGARVLKDSCLVYILEHFRTLWEEEGLAEFLMSIHEEIKKFVTRIVDDLP